MDIKDIPLSELLEPEVPIRSTADDEKMAELYQSISEVDLLQPLVVRPEGDKYRIVAGHRRFIALRALGRTDAPCNVVEVGPAEAALMSLSENLAREDVDPIDEAKYFQYLVSSLGLKHEEIAKRIGKHRVYVTKRISLLRLDPEIQHDITYRGLAPTTAQVLGRLPDKQQRDFYRGIVVKDGASTAVVTEWVQNELARSEGQEAGNPVLADTRVPEISTYNPPACFICGRTLDQGGLKNVWVCVFELVAILESMEQSE